MDDPFTEVGTVLMFRCPRCGHAEQDEYEVIDAGTAVTWRCGGCERPFSVLLTECMHCAAETVRVALAATEQPSPAQATCSQCNRAPLRDEDFAQVDLFA